MLVYYKKYIVAAYALALVVPIASLTAWSAFVGFNVVKTLPGLFASLMLFVGSLVVAMRVMGNVAAARTDRTVALYNESCDPPAFLREAAPVARAVKEPYSEQGSWFLSFYALALADEGETERAALIGERMRASAERAGDDALRAALLVNLEPVVSRLLGPRAALGAVIEADRLLAGADDAESAQRRSFLAWERGVLEARLEGDDAALAEKLAHVRQNGGYPMRMRVLAAFEEADVHHRGGEPALERECLAFAAEHGNQLPAARAARERLAEAGE